MRLPAAGAMQVSLSFTGFLLNVAISTSSVHNQVDIRHGQVHHRLVMVCENMTY